jgi:hypothetical protein
MKTGVSESGATCELSGRIGIHMRMDGQIWAFEDSVAVLLLIYASVFSKGTSSYLYLLCRREREVLWDER